MDEMTDLGKKIKRLREEKEITQQQMAQILGVPRPGISQIEAGKRAVTSTELRKLSQVFQVSADELLEGEALGNENRVYVERDSQIPFEKEKFKQLLLYVLAKCGAKPNVGKTVLYKLLYFCDFDNYELYEEPITGAHYRKIAHGPAPSEFDTVIAEMKASSEIVEINTDYHGKRQTKYIPNAEADLKAFSGREKDVIDKVLERLSDMDATRISDYSHDDIPWKSAKDKHLINYELVFYRTPAYSLRKYPEK